MEKEKPPPELGKDREQYAQSQKLAGSIVAIAAAIPREEKAKYDIPDYLNSRSMRNAFARRALNQSQLCDQEQLEIATNIAKWLLIKMEG